jgi:PAS domain S-box-containing protein
MDYQGKTKEELTAYLLELQHKYNALEESYEKDIAELKRAEKALVESESKYRALIESSRDVIFCVDKEGNYKFVNSVFAATFGKTPDYFYGKSFWDIYSKEHADQRYEAILKVFETGEPGSIEVVVPLPDKTLYYLAKTVPIKDDQGNVILNLTTSTDITERKLSEEALRESENRLRTLNATKDKFFSIIAHDLKSPFNAILGFSNLLVNQVKENDYEDVEKYAEIIQQSSLRAIELLMNLMEWSRSQTGRMEFNPEFIEMDKLIRDIIDLLIDSANQKSINVHLNISPNIPVVADKAMISTVLRNLVSNAIKFTRQGGEIVVSAEQRQDGLMVYVKDNGVGIEKTDIAKLFRIDEIYSKPGTQREKGTGLGLILCKDFIEKHNGKIWLESEVGKGSTFYFSIPIV